MMEPESKLELEPASDIELLFHELADLPADDAERRLLELCPDASRRRMIEQMLLFDRATRDPTRLKPLLSSILPTQILAELTNAPAESPISWKGKFQLLDEIGRGGMGIVYRALDSELGRTVAVKVILAGEEATEEDIALFEHEAKTMACLHHSNILTIYEFHRDGSESWFAMTLLDGETLHENLAEGPMHPRAAAELVREVAEAIAYAHEQDVLHRDLKPSNIFIQRDGTPMVTDFGIAHKLGDSHAQPASQRGSLNYCAPERLLGQDGCAADIYSIGAVPYACLTGKPPHGADRLDLMAPIGQLEIVPAKRLCPSLDTDLNTICMKCLESEPDRRYPSAENLADDLRRFLSNQPIVARPPTILYHLRLAYRRNPMACIMGAATALLLVVALGLYNYARISSIQSEVDQSERHIALARAARDRGNLGQRRASLEHLRAARRLNTPSAESDKLTLRNAMLESLSLVDLQVQRQFASISPDVCAVDPDFQMCAFQVAKDGVCVQQISTGRVICQHIPVDDQLLQMSFSEDGRFLGILTSLPASATHRLQVFDLQPEALCCVDERITGTAWRFSKLGSSIVFCRSNAELVEQSLSDKSHTHIIATSIAANDLCYSGDESQIALALAVEPYIKIIQCADGSAVRAPEQREEVTAITWSNNGNLLAVGTKHEVRLWDMPSCAPYCNLKSHQSIVGSLAFNADDCFLASHSWDHQTSIWDMRTTSRLISFFGASCMRFSRDSSQFAGVVPEGKYGIARLLTDDYCRLVRIPEDSHSENRSARDRGVWSVDFLPGTSLLAASHMDGVSFFSSDSGRLPLHSLRFGHCCTCGFTPDGKALITSGKSGVYYWPVRLAHDDPHTLEIGWPAAVSRSPALAGHRLAISRDSDLMVVIDQDRKRLHIEYFFEPARSFDISLPGSMDSVSLHPQNKALAVGTWNQQPSGLLVVSMSDAARGEVVGERLSDGDMWPNYNLDGNLLLSDNKSHRAVRLRAGQAESLFEVDSPTLTGRGIAAHSRSGRWTAMNIDDTSIRIVNGMDGREAGTLRLRDTGTITCMAFSEDESLLAVGYHNRIVRIWELEKINQLLEEQRLDWSRAPSQSGRIITVRRLDVEASRQLSYPLAFVMVDRPSDSIAIPSVPAVAKSPAVEVNAYEQGVEQATAGQWQPAREHFAVAMNQWPQTAENWHAYALMSLKLGDMAEYQRSCREMVEQFRSSRDPLQRQWTAWTCALADSSVENWETVSSIADSLVASASDDPKGHTHRNTRGLLYLRMKRYYDARDELTTNFEPPGNFGFSLNRYASAKRISNPNALRGRSRPLRKMPESLSVFRHLVIFQYA